MFPAQIDTEYQDRQTRSWADSSPAEPEPLPPEGLEPASLRPEAWMLGPMAGRSPVMQRLFSRMKSTAPHFRLATVEGEAGTGKLLAAQTLHRLGPAAAGPFAPCVAADFLINSQALWKEAGGGLLWLSRVDELSPEQQRELRDLLEQAAHQRMRLGAGAPLQLVAGTSQPLRRLSASGAFRFDLASHLTAIRFELPPLRERRDDIPLLAAIFLRRWIRENGRMLRGFAPGALMRLAAHEWPGNVRELESVVSAAALQCPAQWIRPIDLPLLVWPAPAAEIAPSPIQPEDHFAAQLEPADDSSLDPNLDRAILRHITRVLARVNGNKLRAAKMLGISRSTLYRLLEPGGSRPE